MRMHSQKGMTLVEVLVVIVLIGLIMTVVGKNLFGKSDAAKAELNTVRMKNVQNGLEQYRLKYNSYPSKLDDLMSANSDVKKSGKLFIPLIEKDELNDIWGFPFVYKSENNNRSYSLKSMGSDGVSGGEGAKQDQTIQP